ncbi:MAG: hypothetical protein LBP53_06190 [Candidatus Peribacteria bacterium]|nr:hypothetical protein [Candidatus Peribacteria bacterium]
MNTLKERFGAEETFKEATAIYEEYTKLQANGQQLTNEQQQSIEHYHNSLQLHYETKLQEQFAKSTATYPVVFLMDYFDQQTGTEFTLNQSNDIYISIIEH